MDWAAGLAPEALGRASLTLILPRAAPVCGGPGGQLLLPAGAAPRPRSCLFTTLMCSWAQPHASVQGPWRPQQEDAGQGQAQPHAGPRLEARRARVQLRGRAPPGPGPGPRHTGARASPEAPGRDRSVGLAGPPLPLSLEHMHQVSVAPPRSTGPVGPTLVTSECRQGLAVGIEPPPGHSGILTAGWSCLKTAEGRVHAPLRPHPVFSFNGHYSR